MSDTTLNQLATEINVRLTRKDRTEDHRLAAGILLRQARELVPSGAWGQWCQTNIKRSRGEVVRLLAAARGEPGRVQPVAPSSDEKWTMAHALSYRAGAIEQLFQRVKLARDMHRSAYKHLRGLDPEYENVEYIDVSIAAAEAATASLRHAAHDFLHRSETHQQSQLGQLTLEWQARRAQEQLAPPAKRIADLTQQEAEAKMATWQKPTPERCAELDAQLKEHAAEVNQLHVEILEIEAKGHDNHCQAGELWIELQRRLGEKGFRAEARKRGISVRAAKAAMRVAERARACRSAEEQAAFEERMFARLDAGAA
jgi:hypothetical protein